MTEIDSAKRGQISGTGRERKSHRDHADCSKQKFVHLIFSDPLCAFWFLARLTGAPVRLITVQLVSESRCCGCSSMVTHAAEVQRSNS